MQNYIRQFEDFSRAVPAVAWVRENREKALREFQSLGFPTRKNEDWRYTSVSSLADGKFSLPDMAQDTSSDTARRVPALQKISRLSGESLRVVLVNGIFSKDISDDLSLVAGLEILNLNDGLDESEELKKTLSVASQGVFEKLNRAFWGHGIFIKVKEKTILTKSIHVVFGTTPTEDSLFMNPCLVMSVGREAQAHLVESYESDRGGSHFINAVTHIALASGSHLQHERLQRDGKKTAHVATTHVMQEVQSHYDSFVLSVGARLHRHDLRVDLLAKDAEVELNGLYFVSGNQHVDHHTCVDHRVAYTTSRQVYKGILVGESRAVFAGKVIVAQDASGVDAAQLNKNLLLSAKAEVDTKPQLEIHNGDVKCSHGATVGQINPEEVFYFLSRGINLETAQEILTRGFAADVLTKVKNESVRNYLKDILREFYV
jgi:Fe-S cluster assembly protein SufD